MMPRHSNRAVIETDTGVIAMIGLTILFVGKLWKILRLWNRKVVEYLRRDLLTHPRNSIGDNRIEGNLDYRSLAPEVSEEKIIGK